MKKKKFIVVFLFITFAHLLFSQDLLLLKEFNIKGKKELKIVKMIERTAPSSWLQHLLHPQLKRNIAGHISESHRAGRGCCSGC